MDYETLSIVISQPVQNWTMTEIKKWLKFIHLEKFQQLFKKNLFNGELILNTNNKYLSQIGIISNVNQKKLMAWIEKGFTQFNLYLTQRNFNKENICPNLNRTKTQSTSKLNKKFSSNLQVPIMAEEPAKNRLRITNFEGSRNVYYIAESQGLKIGRNLSNQIQSLEVTVQNKHALIIQQGSEFKLVDLGTRYGSFIKVDFKIQLSINMLIQIGSYLFKITCLDILTKGIRLVCMNTNTNFSEELTIDLSLKESYTLGRRFGNDFAREDQHMSGAHAQIYFFHDKFILKDMGSTNGTWLRLSEINQASQPFTLRDGAIFKIGNTITYICTYQKPQQGIGMHIEDNSHICLNCSQRTRNILFLPCRHSLICLQCSNGISECLLCSSKIEEKVKMYI